MISGKGAGTPNKVKNIYHYIELGSAARNRRVKFLFSRDFGDEKLSYGWRVDAVGNTVFIMYSRKHEGEILIF